MSKILLTVLMTKVELKVLGNWLLADAEVDLSARKLIVVV